MRNFENSRQLFENKCFRPPKKVQRDNDEYEKGSQFFCGYSGPEISGIQEKFL